MQISNELEKEIAERLQAVHDENSDIYEQMADDLAFRDGMQWQDRDELNERDEDGRVSLVINYTKPYIDRIVNPLRLNPVGIKVSTSIPEVTEVIQSVIKGIEKESSADEAYEKALEDAATTGLGFICVGTDYLQKDGFEVKPTIERVKNPTSVWLDRFSSEVDGRDANYAFKIDFLDEQIAVDTYGKDVHGEYAGVDLLKGSWNVPDKSVMELVYYKKSSKKILKTLLADGSNIDGPLPEDVPFEWIRNQREVSESYVEVIHIVGQKVISKTKLNIDFIPIVPVYGDVKYDENGKVKWSGVVHRVRDSQRVLNYYKSNEAELVSLAPKAPFIAEESQIADYDDIWGTANTKNHPYLPYKATTIDGQPVGPPSRSSNAADTGSLIASQESAKADFARQTGMPEQMFGSLQESQQSGKAILLRSGLGELSSAQYMNNLAKSLKQVGRILLQLTPSVGDTQRPVTMVDKEDNTFSQNLRLSDMKEMFDSADVTVTAGPSQDSRKKEGTAILLDMITMMPDRAALVADKIVEGLDMPNGKEIAERFRKMLPPELQEKDEAAPDPAAMEALQQAQQTVQQLEQTIGMYEQVISQMQQKMLDDSAERQMKLTIEQIKSQTQIAVARLKEAGADGRTQAEIEADAEKQIRDLVAGQQKTETQISGKIAETATKEMSKITPLVEGPTRSRTGSPEVTETIQILQETQV